MHLSDGIIALRPAAPGRPHLLGPESAAPPVTVGSPESDPLEIYEIVLLAENQVVGTFGVRAEAPYLRDDQAEFSYAVDPPWRGRGLATRAVILGCRYMAASGMAEEVVLRTDPANSSSVAVARRARFKFLRSIVTDDAGPLDWYVQAV
ncbi:GNAT family N-acetyltransferase [Nocardia higoensis]|uniref:GNAT family N-acetyltransferase n=1 Tax=Nocardia higoensis TaxID=228599 RepID=A0ABS0D734_9NOCA|nr:GNAT family protein [Nocardia higoensis]MBF6354294.1 GNAT family N-acetyltransferase [Nocardia higoensis]